MRTVPRNRERIASVLAAGRELPAGFTRLQEGTTIALATESTLADDGLVLDGPWDLKRFNLNPVILWAHGRTEHGSMPIGRALQVVETRPGTLVVEIEWDREDELGATIARKFEKRFLNAVSVRWDSAEIIHCSKLPETDPRRSDDYWVGRGNVLIEISVVPIGALDTAIAQRSSADPRDQLNALLRAHPELYTDLEGVLLARPTTPRQAPEEGLHHLFGRAAEGGLSTFFGEPT